MLLVSYPVTAAGPCRSCTDFPRQSEDCLYLNIWTPAQATAESKLPVLFWIHGGAFMHGCSSEKEFAEIAWKNIASFMDRNSR